MNPDLLKPKFYDNYDKYQVYLVNDAEFRSLSPAAEEFAGFATSHDQKFVPKHQIWISDKVSDKDRFFYINNALAQLRKMEEGKSCSEAYDYAIKLERKLREQVDHIEFQPHADGDQIPKAVYKAKYGEMNDGGEQIPVWIINGEMVRDLYRTDYVEGGHGYVYRWIPKSEIWIEDCVREEEIPYILIHEFVERELMKYQHMKYAQAHSIAAKVEFIHRQTHLTKAKVLDIDKDEALRLATPFIKDWDGA
jgi:hypothetical protein